MISLWLLKRHVEGVDDKMGAVRSILAAGITPTLPAPPDVGAPSVAAPVTEQPLPAGDISTRFGRPPQDVADAIKRYWPQSQWVNAAELSYMESGWRNTAELNTLSKGPCGTRYWFSAEVGWATTEQSVGIFQINVCSEGGSREMWQNPDANARKGAELFTARGWQPWVISARRLGLRA